MRKRDASNRDGEPLPLLLLTRLPGKSSGFRAPESNSALAFLPPPGHASSPDTGASNELTKWLISKELSTGLEVTFMTGKQSLKKLASSLVAIGLLSATLVAETSSAARYDTQLQNA